MGCTGAILFSKHNEKSCMKMSFLMKYEGNKAQILDYCPFLTDEIYLECQQSSKTKFNKLLTCSLK